MADFIKNKWILLLCITVFVLLKLPALSYPFYWDESWSYEPGIMLMYKHGASLMPNAIDLFFSRGHPLLFYASAATWMHVFGSSNVAQHSFALLISVCLLITVYETADRLFNKAVAVFSLLLLATQVIFFVQSTLLLPEVMVALFVLLTLYFYSAKKYIYTFFACTALMLTKESGMVGGLVLGIHAVYYFFDRQATLREKLFNFFPVFFSGVTIGAFFLLQKKLNGWYLFPEHIGLMNWSWEMFKGKMRFSMEILFYQQQRHLVFLSLTALAVATAVKMKKKQYLLLPALAVLCYIFIGEYMGYLTRRLYLPLLFSFFIYTFHIFMQQDARITKAARKFIYLLLFFCAAYLSFCSLNFFTNRYLLAALILFLILAAYCFELFLRHFKIIFSYLSVVIFFGVSAIAFYKSKGISDVDTGIYSVMRVQAAVIHYFETNKLYNAGISAHSPLQRVHFLQPLTGFRHTPGVFTNVTDEIQATTKYLIVDNIEADTSVGNLMSPEFQPVFTVNEKGVNATIFKKNEKK
ncbi:MAG: glycosyltransferase family 39 protein [Taibaiella sp.]|nr:glycosyltransferase family 39 protein [Taibaiella sp.]